MDPGSCITVAQLAYQGAVKAIQLCRDAINFPSDAEDLLVQLELERFRFQTWGSNAGFAQRSFHESLHPVFGEVRDRLNRIQALFSDARHLGDRFGLVSQRPEAVTTEKVKRLISHWAHGIRDVGIMFDKADESSDDEENKLTTVDKDQALRKRGFRRRVRWAISDKRQFRGLISQLEEYTNKLNQLLTESQYQSLKRDWARINIVIVGKLEDEKSLDIVKQAVSDGHQSHLVNMEYLVEKKKVQATKQGAFDGKKCRLLRLEDFDLPAASTERHRFIAKVKEGSTDERVLFEKKGFESDISETDRTILEGRIKRLVVLLCVNRTSYFLPTLGYMLDAESRCWWLVFRLPKGSSPSQDTVGNSSGLVSLLSRLGNRRISEAPLEMRYRLGSNLAKAYGELFCSNWLHKGIRSENVVFLNPANISSPTVVGFEYSRQESELISIDKARKVNDLDRAIYRHPNYQGNAAMGYTIGYDIYSFGLVLAEIGWWNSLKDTILAATPRGQPRVKLSPTMEKFHSEEATELKNRVLSLVKGKMAFQVGSVYKAVVIWCLEFVERVERTEELWPAALQFNDNVVVPLERLAG